MISAMLEAVMRYVMQDVVVFPCAKKKPLTANGFKDASLHPEDLSRWWTKWPTAQIGLPTGNVNHLFVIDVDSPEAAQYVARLTLPQTFTVQTRPERRQLWFKQPAGLMTKCTSGDLAPGLDTKGDGGYVIGPPSVHHLTGMPYQVVKDLPWAVPPQVLVDLFSATNGHDPAPGAADSIPQGRRHRTLLQIAGSLRARGLAAPSVLAALVVVNQQHCKPPLPMVEVEKLAAYVGTKPAGRAATMETAAEVEIECFANVKPERLRWLWHKRIALGKLNLFVGDPDQGKSLTSIDVGARVSRGSSFPDGAPATAGEVLFLSAEDDPADTQQPRFVAAGADLCHVHRIKAVKVMLPDGATGESHFNLERDIEKLDEKLAMMPVVRLVVIDPITAYLGNVNSWKDAEIRSVLAPLAELAARRSVAVIAIMHLRKSSETTALLRVSGSIAFVAAARTVWGFGQDPDVPGSHVMICIKNNLAARGDGLAYTIEPTADDVPRIVWRQGAVHVHADAVLSGATQAKGEPGALEEAMDYLEEEVLADGPKLMKDIQAQAKRDGFSWATMRRAKQKLRVVAVKNSLTGRWSWRLPPQGAHQGAQKEKMSTFEDD